MLTWPSIYLGWAVQELLGMWREREFRVFLRGPKLSLTMNSAKTALTIPNESAIDAEGGTASSIMKGQPWSLWVKHAKVL